MTAALTPGRPFTGSERQLLENTLQLHRSELLAAVGSLSGTPARLRLVPSLTTPISLTHPARTELTDNGVSRGLSELHAVSVTRE